MRILFFSTKREQDLRSVIHLTLMGRKQTANYIDMQIESMLKLRNRQSFPENTDEDDAFFRGKQEAYEEVKKMLEKELDYVPILNTLIFREAPN